MTLCPHCYGPATMTMKAVTWPVVDEFTDEVIGESGGTFPSYRTTIPIERLNELESIIQVIIDLKHVYNEADDADPEDIYKVNADAWDALRLRAQACLRHD